MPPQEEVFTDMHPMVGRSPSQLSTPALVVDADRLERNIAATAAFLEECGVAWRPHTKGHKSPAIAWLQLAAGAIGVTCATLGEAEVMVEAGIGSVLIANQVAGPGKAERLAVLCRRAEVLVAVDHPAHLRELAHWARLRGTTVPVVIEVDVGMARCGVQPGAPVVELALAASRLEGLRLAGVMAWEGHLRRVLDPEERRQACEQAVGALVDSARRCRAAGLPVEVVSCGGTGTERYSARVPGVTEVQAGGIIFNDVYYSRLGVEHEPALLIASSITSRPRPDRVVTDAGKKAMSTDTAPPRPLGLGGVQSLRFSAEHGVINLSAAVPGWEVGERLDWLPGYVDTTVCLHDEFFVSRRGVIEAVWPIAGRRR